MKKSDFASRLSQALEARGMKAADLSKKTKVAEGTISCYINGRYEAKQNRVQVFAEALDVNPAWLMGYDVPMEAERSPPAPPPPRDRARRVCGRGEGVSSVSLRLTASSAEGVKEISPLRRRGDGRSPSGSFPIAPPPLIGLY